MLDYVIYVKYHAGKDCMAEKISEKLRITRIRKLLQSERMVSISDLARQFEVSEMTIRRDLDKLERTGQVQRTHGGAIPAERMDFVFDFLARRKSNRVQV